jgi:tetratricopeptide (TPR) repeat protein
MEENKPQKQTGWIRSWWTRGVAAFLAVAMTCTIVLANAVRIQLGSDGESASEQALSETTDYINKNPLARAGDVITRFFTNPQTLEQYYQNASVLIGAGQYEQALGLINICITMADASDAALLDELWLKRGCLETLTQQYDAALESFTHISEARITRAAFIKRRYSTSKAKRNRRFPRWNRICFCTPRITIRAALLLGFCWNRSDTTRPFCSTTQFWQTAEQTETAICSALPPS